VFRQGISFMWTQGSIKQQRKLILTLIHKTSCLNNSHLCKEYKGVHRQQ
jgi:hypothetical protein